MHKVDLRDVTSPKKYMNEGTNPETNPPADNVTAEEGKDVKESESSNEIDNIVNKILGEEPEISDVQKTENYVPPVGYFKKLAGREFKNLSDFEQHYKNLSSYVGDDAIKSIRTKAEDYDKLMKEATEIEKTLVEDTKEIPQTQEPAQLPGSEKIKDLETTVSKLTEDLNDEKFVKKYPDAESVLDIVKALSEKTGKSREDVYSTTEIKTLLEDRKTLKELQALPSKDLGVESKTRMSPPKSQILGDLIKQLKNPTNPSKDIDDIKNKLVEEALDLQQK